MVTLVTPRKPTPDESKQLQGVPQAVLHTPHLCWLSSGSVMPIEGHDTLSTHELLPSQYVHWVGASCLNDPTTDTWKVSCTSNLLPELTPATEGQPARVPRNEERGGLTLGAHGQQQARQPEQEERDRRSPR